MSAVTVEVQKSLHMNFNEAQFVLIPSLAFETSKTNLKPPQSRIV